MNNTIVALVVGLAAGVCGALLGGMVARDREQAPAAQAAPDLAGIEARLARIEKALGTGPDMPPALHGTAPEAPSLGGSPKAMDALVDRIEERMRAAMRETMVATWTEFGGAPPPPGEETPFEKKRMTLAEAAVELELSAHEEAELRRIHEDSLQKAIELMADEQGGVEAVKRDLEEATRDPEKRRQIAAKYLGRVIPRVGEFMLLIQDHETKVVELIGKEKANRLETDIELTDVVPYDIENIFDLSGD